MRLVIEQNGLYAEDGGYTEIVALRFDPEVGVLGESAAVNALVADIATEDAIAPGDYARLYDDRGRLWARYWVTSAERAGKSVVRVTAKSDLLLLERPRMGAVLYDGETVAEVVRDIFDSLDYGFGALYTLDSEVGALALHGFCPEQTARERLQWVCFAAGAYVQSWACEGLKILPAPEGGGLGTLVPREDTFYRPRILAGDPVTAVSVRGYAFTQASPLPGEQYVTDQGGQTYVAAWQDVVLQNPRSQPGQFPVNAVSAREVTLLDGALAASAAARLARHCFSRDTVEAVVIDNGDYWPGQRLSVFGEDGAVYTGIVAACAFTFGKQARAALRLAGAERSAAANLTVVDRWNGAVIDARRYVFPVGYGYSVDNPFLDMDWNGARRVFRPLEATVSGTVVEGENSAVVDYAVALEVVEGCVEVVSVDSVGGDGEIG